MLQIYEALSNAKQQQFLYLLGLRYIFIIVNSVKNNLHKMFWFINLQSLQIIADKS